MNKSLKLSILSISLFSIMTSTIVSPILSELSSSFKNASPTLIKMVLTLPSLILIPISFISGYISNKVPKRKIVIIGIIIYTIGGTLGGLANNIYTLLFFRVVIGIGIGLLLPLSRILIADFFDGDERIKMMGISNAVSNLGAISTTLLSGSLALINWRLSFSIYLISILILILVVFNLKEPNKRVNVNTNKKIINKKVIILSLFGLFLNIYFYTLMTNISFFVESNDIGNSSNSSFSISVLTFAGFLSGIFLNKLCTIFKKLKVSISLSFMCLGYLILSKSNNLAMVITSTFLIGLGLGFLKPLLFLTVIDVTPKYSNSFSISLVSSSLFLGKFISPFYIEFIISFFEYSSYRLIFSLTSLSFGISSILALIISTNSFKKIYNIFNK